MNLNMQMRNILIEYAQNTPKWAYFFLYSYHNQTSQWNDSWVLGCLCLNIWSRTCISSFLFIIVLPICNMFILNIHSSLFKIVLGMLRSNRTCFCNSELSRRRMCPMYLSCYMNKKSRIGRWWYVVSRLTACHAGPGWFHRDYGYLYLMMTFYCWWMF